MGDDLVLELLIGYFADRAPAGQARIDAETTLRLDSNAVSELALFLESHFDLTLDRDELGQHDTPGAIVGYIQARRAA